MVENKIELTLQRSLSLLSDAETEGSLEVAPKCYFSCQQKVLTPTHNIELFHCLSESTKENLASLANSLPQLLITLEEKIELISISDDYAFQGKVVTLQNVNLRITNRRKTNF